MHILKSFLTSTILLALVITVYAVPAKRLRRTFTLVDGSQVEATLIGNQDVSYYLTDDGQVVMRTSRGFELGESDDAELEEYVRERVRQRARRIGSQSGAPLGSKGRKFVPLLLVEFQDLPFSVRQTADSLRTYYDLYCNGLRNGERYTGHGSYGSIKDYFVEQSGGQFDPEFVVIGPVRLDSVYAYYGGDRYNSSGKVLSHDENFDLFRKEAIQKALELQVDWTLFDNDKNGSVDMLYLLYAGLGQNNGGDDGTIWPKETTTSVTIDGISFATSATCCELQPKKKDAQGNVIETEADGIGVFIHELSHALGLPDFYDTRGTAFGMDIWSVMDYGEYCGNGYYPVNYTAYERDFMGWETITTVSVPSTLHITCFAEGGGGYKVVNDKNDNEYYILENRQKMGWDATLGRIATGLQVTHVDFSSSRWYANTVNTDRSHQRMTVIAANNLYLGSYTAKTDAEYRNTIEGQLYPGKTDNHELTDESTPASVVFTGDFLGKPIVDIQEENGIVTLKFCPRGTLAQAANLVPGDISDDGFTAFWDEVSDAQYYNVELWSNDELLERRDSVDATSLTFEGLDRGDMYVFRVQPIADDFLNADWSESGPVQIQGNDVVLQPESETLVRVFSLGGSYITQCYADELHRLGLRSGVYVVRPMNGAPAVKIFIK